MLKSTSYANAGNRFLELESESYLFKVWVSRLLLASFGIVTGLSYFAVLPRADVGLGLWLPNVPKPGVGSFESYVLCPYEKARENADVF